MDEGADSGDILDQRLVSIQADDDASSLYKKVSNIAISQIRYFLPLLQNNEFIRRPQNHLVANIWRKRSILDGIIDWRMSAQSIHNLVRGLTRPYVGSHFVYMDNIVKVWKTEVVHNAPINIEPGKILLVGDNGPVVKAGVGAICLREFSPRILFRAGEYL